MKDAQTVCITGAGSGLGKEATMSIARRGHKVIAAVLYNEQMEELLKIKDKENLNIEVIKIDITNNNDREELAKKDIDVFISNAAIADSGSIADINVDRIEDVFKINVFSNIKLVQEILKSMIKNKKCGKIVFVSSLIGRVSLPFLGPYAASRFAIEGIASSLRSEIKILNKLSGTNIQICVIEPGSYATGFNVETGNKKYGWMYENSYFSKYVDLIRKIETRVWELTEQKDYKSIIKKYIKVVETEKLKHRYYAPLHQAAFIQLMRIFGI